MSTILDHLTNLDPITLPAEEDFITQGTPGGVLYVLESGAVDIFKDDTRVARSNQPGAVFGEISLLLDTTHTATVRTTEESTFYCIREPALFFKHHPEAAFLLSKLLAHRLDNLTRYLMDVKHQFEGDSHIGMIDDVLNTLISRHPKSL